MCEIGLILFFKHVFSQIFSVSLTFQITSSFIWAQIRQLSSPPHHLIFLFFLIALLLCWPTVWEIVILLKVVLLIICMLLSNSATELWASFLPSFTLTTVWYLILLTCIQTHDNQGPIQHSDGCNLPPLMATEIFCHPWTGAITPWPFKVFLFLFAGVGGGVAVFWCVVPDAVCELGIPELFLLYQSQCVSWAFLSWCCCFCCTRHSVWAGHSWATAAGAEKWAWADAWTSHGGFAVFGQGAPTHTTGAGKTWTQDKAVSAAEDTVSTRQRGKQCKSLVFYVFVSLVMFLSFCFILRWRCAVNKMLRSNY